MSPLSLAVVGCGLQGTRHIKTLMRLHPADLCAVVDVDQATARAAGELAGAPHFTSLRDAIRASGAEAVVVSTPATTHRDVVREALEEGCHVLVEKPPATSSWGVEELWRAAEEKGTLLGVGLIERYNPAVEAALDLVERGEIGAIRSVEAQRFSNLPRRPIDVGVVLDLAVHDLDLAARLLDRGTLDVESETVSNPLPFEDSASIRIRCGGVEARVDASWVNPDRRRTLRIEGSDGVLHIDYVEQTLTSVTRGSSWSRKYVGDPLLAELTDFIGSVRSGKPPRVGPLEGLKAVRLCEAALEAAAAGKRVEVVLPR